MVPTTKESFDLVHGHVAAHAELRESVQVGSGQGFKHQSFVMAEAAIASSGTVGKYSLYSCTCSLGGTFPKF